MKQIIIDRRHKMNRLYPNFGRTSALMDWQKWWRELISRKCIIMHQFKVIRKIYQKKS